MYYQEFSSIQLLSLQQLFTCMIFECQFFFQLSTMLATCSLTTTLQAKYRDYIDKINLTEEAKTRSYQLLNELGLIDLIYSSTNHQNKQAIEEKLGQIDKVIEGKLKSQGWMTYFTKVSEVVSLEEVWRVISTFQNDPRQNLINDICQLKLNIDKQSELAASNK